MTGGRKGNWKPRLPREAKIMMAMRKTNCISALRLRKYRRYPYQHCHRLYLEYCPYGDLSILIDRYRRHRQVDHLVSIGLSLICGRCYFPEAFIWEVFYHLLEVAHAMSRGPVGGTWNYQVVHMDIKPANGKRLHLARLLLRYRAIVKSNWIIVRVLSSSLL